jgi:putative transposase
VRNAPPGCYLRQCRVAQTATSTGLRAIKREDYPSEMTKFPRPPQRLQWIYTHNPLYFVTCCTYRRRPLLANDRIHNAFIEFAARGQNERGVAVGRDVILPDHLHFFVALPQDLTLGQWVGTLKRMLGKKIERSGSRDPVWRRGFFDHVLRSAESYSEKWDYVRQNPIRAGLVKNVDGWPYAGEIVALYYD